MLLALIAIVTTAVHLYPERKVMEADSGIRVLADQLNQRFRDDSIKRSSGWKSKLSPPHDQRDAFLPEYFDPNTVLEEELKQMGIPDRISKSILAYRNHGGKFRYKEDVKKLYGLTPQLYSDIEPYITLPVKGESTPNAHSFRNYSDSIARMASIIVELNSADSASLVALKGIGPASAKRILLYRNRLGGFYAVDQLTDIYGISPETIEKLKKNLVLDTSLIIHIELNTISVDSLASHPYVTLYQARAIEYYRGKKGTIHSMDELVRNRILPQEVAQKLGPYIRF